MFGEGGCRKAPRLEVDVVPLAQLGSRARLCTRFIPGSEGAPASLLVLSSTSPQIPPVEGLPPSQSLPALTGP